MAETNNSIKVLQLSRYRWHTAETYIFPWREKQEHNSYGVHLSVFQFYCVLDTVLTLSKSGAEIDFFEIMKMFHPPSESTNKNQYGVHLSMCVIFYWSCCSKNVFDTFVSFAVVQFAEILKIFYPSKWIWESRTLIGSILISFVLVKFPETNFLAYSFKRRKSTYKKFFHCVDGWVVDRRIDGWVDGLWYFTLFDFPYFHWDFD